MNLDDFQQFPTLDTQDMLGYLNRLPEQLQQAWAAGLNFPLPDNWNQIRQVVVCGMGGSSTAGDLFSTLMQPQSRIPVTVCRHYELPAWVQGEQTLVIACSYSGETEELLAMYQQAVERGLPIIAMTTGGTLAALAQQNHHTLWQYSHDSASIMMGWGVGLLLALAHRLGWLADLEAQVADAVQTMQQARERYRAEIPTAQNPAKRQGGQWIERLPIIYGGGVFEIVARYWKEVLNKNAKLLAGYEPLPEANHHTMNGIAFPEAILNKVATCFLESSRFDHPRVALRQQFTKQIYLQAGIMIDSYMPRGNTLLGQVWDAIYFGDFLSYYAALANDADPSAIDAMLELKAMLSEIG